MNQMNTRNQPYPGIELMKTLIGIKSWNSGNDTKKACDNLKMTSVSHLSSPKSDSNPRLKQGRKGKSAKNSISFLMFQPQRLSE
jgi:hypothetical protein